MMDLFSSFNPISSNHLSLNWLMIIVPMLMTQSPFWTLNSINLLTQKMFTKMIIIQFKPSMPKINMSSMIIIITIMSTIAWFNLISLMPNTFSPTSHIIINISLALPLWWGLMKKKMLNITKMLSNLTPTNTPPLLIPFMVMIELVSIIIQPITLSVRLTANITAGHIMMILISQLYHFIIIPTLIMNIMMIILELGVSIIQAYVFSMLIIMYSK